MEKYAERTLCKPMMVTKRASQKGFSTVQSELQNLFASGVTVQ